MSLKKLAIIGFLIINGVNVLETLKIKKKQNVGLIN